MIVIDKIKGVLMHKHKAADIIAPITLTGDVTGSGNNEISTTLSDNTVSPSKLNQAFRNIVPISASDVDFADGQVFTKTLIAETTLTFSNLYVGVKDLEIIGGFLLHLPAWVKIIDGTYDGTVENLIQIMCTNAGTGTEKGWAIISQEAI